MKKNLHQLLPGVRFLLMGAFLFISTTVLAQNITVHGVVTDASNGETIVGASVVLKGTTNAAITGIDGKYSLKVPANSTLQISFIGYKKAEVLVAGKTEINVVLTSETIGLDEVVAIGYGTLKKRDLTGPVSSVNGDALRAIPVASAAEAIQGKLAGVQVITTEGSPDAEITIRVRGGGSITQNNSPLYIVDGFPVNSITDISPSDIQTIDVLKDASSTAIYGSRGANGVIIVTTKSGKSGKLSVSYNSYLGFKKIAKELKVLNPEDYVNWQYEYANLANTDGNISSYQKYFGAYQDIDLFANQPGNNWQDQVYGRTGQVFNHDLSVRGGSEKFTYSLNYAHINEKSIMIGSDYSRDNISVKFNHNPNDKIQLSYSFRYSDTKIGGGGANEQNEVSSADSRLKYAVANPPIPIAGLIADDTNADASSYLISPLVSTADNDRQQSRKYYSMAASFSWNIIKDLQFKSEVGLDYYNNIDNRFYGVTTYYVNNTPAAANQGHPAVVLNDSKQQRFRNTNTLNYDFKKMLNDDHHLKVLLGQELINSTSNQLKNVVHGFPKLFTSDKAFKLTTQGVANSIDNNYSPDDKLLSFFGRANYDFKNKYLLSATFRADGSSKFLKGNRWGYFPSAAAAWRISQENFMQGTSSWLDDLKLRLSYGVAGNNNIPPGQMVQPLTSGTTSWMDAFTNFWSASKTLANPDLKWETTYTRNIGLDFSFFKGRLNGSLETYLNNTKRLLMEFPIPGTGYETQFRNTGETQNKGLELTLNAVAIDKKNVGLNFTFNIGFNKNKIKSLGVMTDYGTSTGWASTDIGTDYWIATGGSVGEMYGYVSDGRYEVSDFTGYNATTKKWTLKDGVVDDSNVVGALRPGTIKLKDIAGTDNLVTINDRKVIGDANPVHTGGFTINGRVYGFDMSAVFNWSYGNNIYNANKIEYTTSTPRYQYRNMTTDMSIGNRWTNIDPASGALVNDPATLEAMNANTTMWSPFMSKFVFTDWAVEDGSFLRLNTLTVGYTLPSILTQKVNIQSLRFYVTGYNVFVLTNYSGFDPEVSTRRKTPLTPGVDYSAYPKSRQLVFGLNLNF